MRRTAHHAATQPTRDLGSSSLWSARLEAAFIGRVDALDGLRNAFLTASQGDGRCVLVRGEAGMGKSKLLHRFAELVRAEGGQVLFAHGRSDPGAPALWPWIEVLRRLLQAHATAERDIGQLLHAFAPWLPLHLCPRSPVEPSLATSAFALHDTLVQLVLDAGRREPLLLILEDVHDFDPASLDVAAKLLEQLPGQSVLVVASCRLHDDLRVRETADLGAFSASANVLLLEGLVRDEVHELMERGLQQPVPRQLTNAVHQRSEGNPLYVSAVVSTLAASAAHLDAWVDGSQPQLPASVRHAGQQHLSCVAESCRHVLKLAAVLGRVFDLNTLMRFETIGCDRVTLEAELLQACRERILHRVAMRPGVYRFSHTLLREVLEQQWEPHEWRKVNGEAARALATHDIERDPRLWTRIARHWLACATNEGLERAIARGLPAGRAAESRGAHAEAADAFELVVTALRRRMDASSHVEVSMRDALAHSLFDFAHALWRSGQPVQALAHFAEVQQMAQAIGNHRLLVDAALAVQSEGCLTLLSNQVELCERACTVLTSGGSPERVRLLAGLGGALCQTEQRERGVELVNAAARLLEEHHDSATELAVLKARYYSLDVRATLCERRNIIERCSEAVARCNDVLSVPCIEGWRLTLALESADASAVEVHRVSFQERAKRAGGALSWYARVVSCTEALLRGRFDEAERISREARELGVRAHAQHADLLFLLQSLTLQRCRGNLDGVVERLRLAAERLPHLIELRATLGACEAELGRSAEARLSLVCALADPQLSCFALCQHALTSYELGDQALAQEVYLRLLPFDGRCAVTLAGVICLGAVGRFLGLAASTAGHTREAIAHFEAALEINRAMGARPALALTHFELGKASADSKDSSRSHMLEALRLAESLGMVALAGRARRFCDQLDSSPPDDAPQDQNAPERSANVFRMQGSQWLVCYRGQSKLLPDLKGMRYLVILLREPEKAFHVAELITIVDGVANAPVHGAASGTVVQAVQGRDELLDSRSIAVYRARARDLVSELAEAEDMQDLGRMEALNTELELLKSELADRSRARHAPTERARKAVYNRLRQAIEQIEQSHPELGRHLLRSIKTGAHCTYFSQQEAGWRTSE